MSAGPPLQTRLAEIVRDIVAELRPIELEHSSAAERERAVTRALASRLLVSDHRDEPGAFGEDDDLTPVIVRLVVHGARARLAGRTGTISSKRVAWTAFRLVSSRGRERAGEIARAVNRALAQGLPDQDR